MIDMLRKLVVAMSLVAAPALLVAQQPGGLDPKEIYKPLKDEWLTYAGDYTGRRYSALTAINQTTVKNLSLAWTSELSGPPATGGGAGAFGGFGGFGRGGGAGADLIVSGEGTGEFTTGAGTPAVKGAILKYQDRLYISAPDHVWALDAQDGHEIWHFYWKTRGGTHIGNRGVGLWHDYLFVETPDDFLVSLDARTGKERWHKEFVSFGQQYFSTFPPIIIDNHVIAGTGNDLDMPGVLQSFDPETGDLQWKFYTVPMKEGDPGLDTWPSLDAARHGGGQVWVPGAFDPESRLYIFGTGNPTPGYTGAGRKGDNLFTCSLVAINVDTGKMAWYFQTSPHDTHDWDSSQTPILIDAPINGRNRKLVLQATRNGYYFVLDRVTGENVTTTKAGSTTNWAKGIRPNGTPDPSPEKEATVPGSLVSPPEGGVVNWPPPAYSPDSGLLLYQRAQRLESLVPDGYRPARIDGPRGQAANRRRFRTQLPDGHRVDDREDRLAPRVHRERRRRAAHDGGPRAVLGRWERQLRRPRRPDGQAALAFADRQHHERSGNLHDRRQAARARGRREHTI